MSSEHPPAPGLDIAQALAGKRLFITGATGFLGKVLVEKLLWSVPEVGKLVLLIRTGSGQSAEERLRQEILEAPILARLRARHGDGWQRWVAEKVEAVAGELGEDRFGLDAESYGELCRRVDGVVAAAATVTFDERLDRSLEVNVHGALRCLELARDAGNVPLLQVSTCFVSGRRKGDIPERVVDTRDFAGALDFAAALASLEKARAALRADGGPGDRAWVAAGAAEAERFGFNDIYTLTKALAEGLLARDRGDVPLAVLRPAIVESAAREPIPGWIEAVRVADPLLVAYGRGRTDELPGTADTAMELIPVDLVVNALIAALAALSAGTRAGGRPDQDEIQVHQLGSHRNPITLGELLTYARQGFARTPLRDEAGEPIAVGPARFTEPERYRRALIARRRRLRALARWLPRRRTSPKRLALGSAERTLDHLIHLLSVYRPYLSHGAHYDDARTQALWARLSAADRETFPFDISGLDWPTYVAGIHVPGLLRFALKAESGAPPPSPQESREPEAVILARAVDNAAAANTLFELFAATAEAYPEVMFLQTFRHGRWLRYTYRQALTATVNVAARLAAQYGIGRGDRVLLWASGSPEWVITTFAAHRLGAVTVPLDPQWPAAEIVQAARLVEGKLICAAPKLVAALADSADGSNGFDGPVVSLAAPFVPEPDVPLLPGAEAVGAIGNSQDLASILFTSGTTVAPKAVPLTHGNYLANVRDLVPLMQLTRERLLSVLPMHHVFEQMVGLLVPMAGGGTISYVAEIKPAEISWMMNTTRPTVLVAVPRLLTLLHGGIRQSVEAGGPKLKLIFKILFALSRRSGGANGHKLFAKVHRRFGGSLRRIASGGSALDPELGRTFQLMGFQVAEGYGMTETSPVLTVNPWQAIRFGSVGQPLPGVDIELRPPAEAVARLAPGAGEVWVRGANVMSGYYRNPEATAAVLDDGWLNTGDIGFFDTDGYLHLAGRTKDVIVTSAGKNVYPEEVEARYKDLPGAAELVILGLPVSAAGTSIPGGSSDGERVTALIVPAPGADEGAIRAAVAERSATVPSYQQIAGIEFWRGDLPKTTTMKVKRAVLRQAVLAGQRGDGPGSAPPPPPPAPQKRSPAEAAILESLARLTRTRPDLLSPTDRLADLGVDSLTRVELVGELEARFGRRLDDDQAAGLEKVEDLFELGRRRA
jgi:long-chain acyl-CoA synthetase